MPEVKNYRYFLINERAYERVVCMAVPPVATSNSPTCGRVKLLHPGWRDEGTLVGYEAFGKHARGAPVWPELRSG